MRTLRHIYFVTRGNERVCALKRSVTFHTVRIKVLLQMLLKKLYTTLAANNHTGSGIWLKSVKKSAKYLSRMVV